MGAGSGFFLILTQLTFFTKFSTLIMVSRLPLSYASTRVWAI